MGSAGGRPPPPARSPGKPSGVAPIRGTPMSQTLPVENAGTNGAPTAGPDKPVSKRFACPELRDETTALLRTRLRAVTLIFFVAFGLFLVRDLILGHGHGFHQWHERLLELHLAVVVIFGVGAAFL